VVYSIDCQDCDFVYVGQTDRALKTRIKEHKNAVKNDDEYSKIAQHTNTHLNRMDFENTKVVDREPDHDKRLFLEAWHSLRQANAGNDHNDIPEIYDNKTVQCNYSVIKVGKYT
jgi:hypothetical protein